MVWTLGFQSPQDAGWLGGKGRVYAGIPGRRKSLSCEIASLISWWKHTLRGGRIREICQDSGIADLGSREENGTSLLCVENEWMVVLSQDQKLCKITRC